MAEHTEGPWTWGEDWPADNATLFDINGSPPDKYLTLGLFGADGRPIIPIRIDHYQPEWDTDGSELTAADRALIAAAPDLLKAARRALAVLRATNGQTTQPGNVLDALEKAIAKAGMTP